MTNSPLYGYTDTNGNFQSDHADSRTMYFPLCGPTAKNLKSSITPFLSGDLKIDKDHYLTKPTSTEDLRNPLRSFYVHTEKGIFSVANPHSQNVTT